MPTTFEDVMDSMLNEPTVPTSGALIWYVDKTPKATLKDAAIRRYAVVTGLLHNVRETLHHKGTHFDQLIQVLLYDKPDKVANRLEDTPDKTILSQIYEYLLFNMRFVDDLADNSILKFISIEPNINQQPPRLDPKSSGIYARASFRMRMYRP